MEAVIGDDQVRVEARRALVRMLQDAHAGELAGADVLI